MTLITFSFFLFVTIICTLYYIFPFRLRPYLLIIGSFVYFYLNNTLLNCILSLILLSLVLICACFLHRNTQEGLRRIVYFTCVSILVVTLILLKYVNLLPLTPPTGISFWMLTAIGYLTDIYLHAADYHSKEAILLISFYPLMTSGPILRQHETAEDLVSPHKLSYQNITFGLQRIVWGCFKKLVISERLACLVNSVYADYQSLPSGILVIGMFCFSFQLYTDFSGCMDIVIGCAQLFGIVLPENFRTPFFSKTVSEFWRRWHITLGLWLKDYVMYPILHSNPLRKLKKICKKRLGRQKGDLPALYLTMFISWFLIGYWHGGSWNYIIGVGIWFWFIIVIGELLSPLFQRVCALLHINKDHFVFRLFQSIRTFLLVSVGLSFFRSASLAEAIYFWKAIFLNMQIPLSQINPLGLDKSNIIVLVIGLCILLVISILQNRGHCVRDVIAGQPILIRWSLYLMLFFSVILFGIYGPGIEATNFIYQGF